MRMWTSACSKFVLLLFSNLGPPLFVNASHSRENPVGTDEWSTRSSRSSIFENSVACSGRNILSLNESPKAASRMTVHSDDAYPSSDMQRRYPSIIGEDRAFFPRPSPQPLELAWRSEPLTSDFWSDISLNKFTKTGTTIVGVAGSDYCILGADSRATSSTLVADKRCWKIHPLAQNCAAAGAGTSADLDHLTRECHVCGVLHWK
jgi:Proteasome subunit